MLDSTIELISLAASNSLAVFCFCNLIIAILLVGSSRPSSQFDEVKPNAFPTIVNDDNFKKNTVSSCEKANALIETEEENVSCVSIDMVDNEEETPDVEEEDDVDDDELRRRVEEFIEKINRGWRAEKLKTYSLGQ
ncbi:hypothetical protein Pfo_014923 [Paulownia fortunei]|nr:hypothetical protein Pfo_014923 [Paulownia fortunei]